MGFDGERWEEAEVGTESRLSSIAKRAGVGGGWEE